MDHSNVKYNNTCVTYESNDTIDSKGAEIAFMNVGNGPDPVTGIYSGSKVVILGFILYPGQFIAFDGNEKELDVTKYQIYFIGPWMGSNTKNLAVFQKNFV